MQTRPMWRATPLCTSRTQPWTQEVLRDPLPPACWQSPAGLLLLGEVV